jgi:hypothetical protein
MVEPYLESDLVHNRAGRLSPDQIARQTRSLKTMTWVLGGLSALTFGIGILLSIRGDQGGLIGAWIFAGCTLAVCLTFWRTALATQREGAVSMVRGTVMRETETDDGSKVYFLRIGGLRLRMMADDFDQFSDGETYKVYYIPKTNYLVSGEPAL